MTRKITLKTPATEEKLLLGKLTMREEMGRLFSADVELLSTSSTLDFNALLGKDMTVTLEMDEGVSRYYHGFISEVSQAPLSGRFYCYRVRLVPWLWFLTLASDCRIFQDLTVPNIIDKILRELGLTDFSMQLQRSQYRRREICVQYRETHWAFISRLMEQEGIYFYTTHESGKHSVTFVDSASGHPKIAAYQPIEFNDEVGRGTREERVQTWALASRLKTGKVTLKDFNYLNPNAVNKYVQTADSTSARSSYECYDSPGDFIAEKEATSIPTYGKQYAQVALEALQAGQQRICGTADACHLSAGGLFRLSEHPRKDQNGEYLLVACTHELTAPEYESNRAHKTLDYRCSFEALPARTQFRLAQSTEHPAIAGTQTAIVCGSKDEEIWTDQYGRVKVQFHQWDRLGKNDENSSCWVRVAQTWAGKSWGAQFIPRIGHEVVISFIEGDPDRPLVIGSVYNGFDKGGNGFPYDLPANKTRSGIKSRSSKGGGDDDFNEFSFEDKKGEEQIILHAQKDFNEVVENDHTVNIGHNETETVKNDLVREVGHNETVTIKADYSHEVDGNEKRTVKGNRDVSVTGNESYSVTGNESIKSDNTMTLQAMNKLTITCGASSIELTPAGINIKSPMVTVEGTGQLQLKSSGMAQLSAPMVTVQGNALLNCESSGLTMLKGSIVLIN